MRKQKTKKQYYLISKQNNVINFAFKYLNKFSTNSFFIIYINFLLNLWNYICKKGRKIKSIMQNCC